VNYEKNKKRGLFMKHGVYLVQLILYGDCVQSLLPRASQHLMRVQ